MTSSRRSVIFGGTALILSAHALARESSEWKTASPKSQGISSAALEQAFATGSTIGALRSLLVVRNGVLVGERYFGGAKPNDLLPINSVTKSVCSLLIGQAIEQGKLKGFAQTVGELLPDQARSYPGSAASKVTLGRILAGTTGIAYDFKKQYDDLTTSSDPVQFVFNLPNDGRGPGTWSYNDAAVSLLSPILERAHGMPMEDIAKRDLFAPLGIESFLWDRDKGGRAMSYKGLKLRSRDMARLSWVMANGGKWLNTKVVPSAWVAASSRTEVTGVWPSPPIASAGYGLLWFTGTLEGRYVVWALGYGGQIALFVPSLKLAVATAATNPRMQDVRSQTEAITSIVAKVVGAAT